jgi:ribosomal protein S18 acetylase RimI-like enzyme
MHAPLTHGRHEHVVIRPLRASDRSSVEHILVSTGHFTPVEIDTALELVDAWLASGESSGYLTYVLDASPDGAAGDVRGYACFGPTPLTDGTYDLYWIAVDAHWQCHGYGRHLLAFTETEVQRLGGRLLLIETSSQELYGGTIRFYERSGYPLVARIPNFYRAGDDKLVFGKEWRKDGRG